MAERAHPEEPGFQDRWIFKLRRGFIPWWTKNRSPYRAAFLWRYNWVSKFCRGMDVIDVPCGMGWGTSLISGARSIKGFDLSRQAIDEAMARYGSHANFEVGDMCKLNILNNSVDVVSCLEGIEHVPSDVGRSFLSEAHRVLRPEGRLLISSPYCRTMPHSGNPYHIYEYKPEEIHELLGEFFSIETCETKDVDIMTVLYLNCQKKK
jgi:ubiquinone/menaquinone biosynthesis C-methylase UbiE